MPSRARRPWRSADPLRERPGAEVPLSTHSEAAPRILRPWAMPGRWWAVVVAACLGLAAVSVAVLPRALAYDPYSWLIWGREITHLQLDTRNAATSVKPLAIAIDTVLAFGGSAAPALWLFAARAAALVALALAFRLACRYGGVVAGVIAAVALAGSDEYLGYLFLQGMSEPMAAGAVLAAIDSHVRGRRGWAVGWLLAAAWLRPEAWPALILYVLWLTYRGPLRRTLLALAGAVAVPISWFVIDWFGARQFLRSANAATHQSQGGPLLARYPGLATIRESWQLCSAVVVVVFLLAVAAMLLAWRRSGRRPPLLWLAAVALGWLVVDAVLAQGHFATGAARYLLPGDAIACVVVGAFVADVARAAAREIGGAALARGCVAGGLALVVLAAFVPRALGTAHQVRRGERTLHQAHDLRGSLRQAIARSGGRAAVIRCGHVTTQAFQVPLVAWELDLPVGTVGIIPSDPGTVFMRSGAPRIGSSAARAYRLVGTIGPPDARWTTYSTCAQRP